MLYLSHCISTDGGVEYLSSTGVSHLFLSDTGGSISEPSCTVVSLLQCSLLCTV